MTHFWRLCAVMVALTLAQGCTPDAPAPSHAAEPSPPSWRRVARDQLRAAQRFDVVVGANSLARVSNTRAGFGARFDAAGLTLLTEAGQRCRIELARAPATDQRVQRNRLWRQRGAELTEWFVNGPHGLEHGFVVRRADDGAARTDDTLRLPLRVSGDLAPRVLSRQALALATPTGRRLLRYGGLRAFDATGRALEARFELAANDPRAIAIVVETRGARYPLTIDPLVTVDRELTPAPTHTHFGEAMAMKTDGTQLAISARGASFLYELDQTQQTVRLLAKLEASGLAAGTVVGSPIAIDSFTVAVGAPTDGDKGINAGAVYIFTGFGGPWRLQQKITASDGVANSAFGLSVAVAANTIAVGAGLGNGAAYIFSRSGSTWTQTQKISWGAQPHVAMVRDVGAQRGILVLSVNSNIEPRVYRPADATGQTWIADTPPTLPTGGPLGATSLRAQLAVRLDRVLLAGTLGASLAAAVLSRPPAPWTGGLVSNPNALAPDFGRALAFLSNDAVAVGAVGQAFVYREFGSNSWPLAGSVTSAAAGFGAAVAGFNVSSVNALFVSAPFEAWYAPEPTRTVGVVQPYLIGYPKSFPALDGRGSPGGDRYGESVAVDGALGLVGAPNRTIGQTRSGAVFVFAYDATGWKSTRVLAPSSPAADARFGKAVAIQGGSAIIGAPGANAAYVFDASAGTQTAALAPGGAGVQPTDRFGAAVAQSGSTVVVGAPAHGGDGALYVFVKGSGASYTQQAKLAAAGVKLGAAVAISAGTIAAADAANQRVLVYTRAGATWSLQATITPPTGAPAIKDFASAVALDGDRLAVGAPGDVGQVVIYQRSGNSWSQQARFSALDARSGDAFGRALQMRGSALAVGAQDAAYLMVQTAGGWLQRGKFANPGDIADAFGAAVATSEDDLFVGALNTDKDHSPAYAFHLVVKPNGTTCGDDSDCLSNICSDGQCCFSKCEGVCRTCTSGTCQNVPLNQDITSGATQCKGDLTCDGRGECRKALGIACSSDLSCASGQCFDSVCCDKACSGACRSCALPGSEGKCSAVDKARDPDSCGDVCRICSAGTCASVAADVEVDLGADLTCNNDSACNGKGACKKKVGKQCAAGDECISDHCADGVCCSTACDDGPCRACNLEGTIGTCTFIAAGDPAGECIGTHRDCGGACDGKGQCEFPGIGTRCGTCKACDGTGRCTTKPDDDDACGIVDCDDLDNACRDYSDLDAERCAAFGKCKVKNDPATCTKFTKLGSCAADASAGTDGDGATPDDGGGCGCGVRAGRPSSNAALLFLLALLALAAKRRRRRRYRER